MIKNLIIVIRDSKKSIITILLLLILFTVTNLLLPLINKYLVDKGILKNDYAAVLIYTVCLTTIFIFNQIINFFIVYCRTCITRDASFRLYSAAFEAIINTDIYFFQKKNSSEIYNNVTSDVENILSFYGENTFYSLLSCLTFLGGLIGLIIISPSLSLLVLVFIPIKFFLVFLFAKHREHLFSLFLNANTKFSAWFGEFISGTKEIRLFALKDNKYEEFTRHLNYKIKTEAKISLFDSCNFSTDSILIRIISSLIIVIGTHMLFDERFSLGSLFAFMAYSTDVLNPISILMNIKLHISSIKPSYDRFFNFIKQSSSGTENQNVILKSIDYIQFKNISLLYGEKKIFDSLSLNIKKGDIVAIVGKNGTGKTTLVQLLQGFISPSSGAIHINGINFSQLHMPSLMRMIAAVNQNDFIFNTSIYHNLKLSRNIDEVVIKDAINNFDLATLYSEYSSKPIGHNACCISGGQRQKISIARSLIEKKYLYIFDEFDRNLDKNSKEKIISTIFQMVEGKIAFFITHDLSIIKYCNKIIKINSCDNIKIEGI